MPKALGLTLDNNGFQIYLRCEKKYGKEILLRARNMVKEIEDGSVKRPAFKDDTHRFRFVVKIAKDIHESGIRRVFDQVANVSNMQRGFSNFQLPIGMRERLKEAEDIIREVECGGKR